MRALALVLRTLSSLEQVRSVLRLTVYVQCTADFTQQSKSEVADGASALLFSILCYAGAHMRTSAGVQQLSKNGAGEVDWIAAVRDGA